MTSLLTPQHRAHLQEKGWVVIPDILASNQVQNCRDGLWEWLERLSDGKVKQHNPKTWKPFNRWPTNMHGLFQHFRAGHLKVVWALRQYPPLVQIFADLWNVHPEELLVSFDGLALTVPGHRRSNWGHTDQAPNKKDLCCVQGQIVLYNSGENDGGLVVWDKSHLAHEGYFKSIGNKSGNNWYKFPPGVLNEIEIDGSHYLIRNKNQKLPMPRTKICAPAGSLILWDSRTFHQGEQPAGKIPRSAIFVCYTPRTWATENNLRKKRKAFEEGRMTNHWPHIIKLFPKDPHNYGKPQLQWKPEMIGREELSELGQKLAGF